MTFQKRSVSFGLALTLLSVQAPLMARAEAQLLSEWLAQQLLWPRDKKRTDPPPQLSGRSAGSRGCTVTSEETSALPALMLFSPVDRVAQTRLSQPSFAWYLGAHVTQPLFFRIYEPDTEFGGLSLLYEFGPSEFVNMESVDQSQGTHGPSTPNLNYPAGISILDLAAVPQAPRLKPGNRYIWQVELVCDPKRPSGNLFAQVALEVLAPLEGSAWETSIGSPLLWQDALKASFVQQGDGAGAGNNRQALLKAVVLNDAELTQLADSPLHQLTNWIVVDDLEKNTHEIGG